MRAFDRVGCLVLAAGLAGPALASILDINSVRIQERRFNDYPSSTLVTTSSYPSLVGFSEGPFGQGGFANQHVARFSADGGASAYLLNNQDAFDISFSFTLDVGSVRPRKEGGFRLDSFVGGESFFIFTSDGEVAAFGGPFPFHSFGGSAYTVGDVGTFRVIYTPDDDPLTTDGDAATIEYIYNGVSSGPLNFSNVENGIITGTDIGMYIQNQPDDANPADFSDVEFRDITIRIPEPASLLLLAACMLLRRR